MLRRLLNELLRRLLRGHLRAIHGITADGTICRPHWASGVGHQVVAQVSCVTVVVINRRAIAGIGIRNVRRRVVIDGAHLGEGVVSVINIDARRSLGLLECGGAGHDGVAIAINGGHAAISAVGDVCDDRARAIAAGEQLVFTAIISGLNSRFAGTIRCRNRVYAHRRGHIELVIDGGAVAIFWLLRVVIDGAHLGEGVVSVINIDARRSLGLLECGGAGHGGVAIAINSGHAAISAVGDLCDDRARAIAAGGQLVFTAIISGLNSRFAGAIRSRNRVYAHRRGHVGLVIDGGAVAILWLLRVVIFAELLLIAVVIEGGDAGGRLSLALGRQEDLTLALR